ncbi:MAG: Nif3-like dinuclear metal center hexameric protein [Bacteroidota bacterium]
MLPFDFSESTAQNRRNFIRNTGLILGGTAMLNFPGISFAQKYSNKFENYTVQNIIDLIIKEAKLTAFKDTVDTIKFGSPDQIVTGIVSTMFPTVAVIEEAVRLKANLIIAHEPTFYSAVDNMSKQETNAMIQKKQTLLKEHGIVVWRFHDYSHFMQPDMISLGVKKKMGWEAFQKKGEPLINIPSISLEKLIDNLKKNLSIQHLRTIGDLKQTCSSISLLPGAWGEQAHINAIEKNSPDVLIIGELVEWETAEYVRDARKMGSKTALIILGHSVSEEPGMELFVEWLTPKVPGLPITHIASGDPFLWI